MFQLKSLSTTKKYICQSSTSCQPEYISICLPSSKRERWNSEHLMSISTSSFQQIAYCDQGGSSNWRNKNEIKSILGDLYKGNKDEVSRKRETCFLFALRWDIPTKTGSTEKSEN